MAVTSETLRIAAGIRRDLENMSRAQTVALTKAWVEAWDVLMPEFQVAFVELLASGDAYISQANISANIRLRDALQHSRTVLDELANHTNEVVVKDLSQAVLDAAAGHAALVGSQLPANSATAGVSFNRVSQDALTAIVERTTERIHSVTKPLPADVERVMKRELIRGVATGTNPRATAARIIRQTEGRFNGGLTRALTIARTETISAHNEAAFRSSKSDADVLESWEWSAALSARSCIACISKHGTRYDISVPGPLGHQNCRCTRLPVTKTWAELGFAGITEPKSSRQDSEEWFSNLTPETQKEIMGSGRLELYQSGAVKWADLSQVKDTPGWRESVVVTPLADLRKSA